MPVASATGSNVAPVTRGEVKSVFGQPFKYVYCTRKGGMPRWGNALG